MKQQVLFGKKDRSQMTEVDCPSCKAVKDQPCTIPGTRVLITEPHQARVKAWVDKRNAQRV